MNEQNLPIIDYSNEEICEKILLDESEELYDKVLEEFTNKTVSDVASDNSESSLLSLLPQNELSDVKGPTQRLTAYTYRREEHRFVHSEEIDNEDNNNDH